MADFVIKAGTTRPILTDTLTYSDGSTVDLSGGTVNFVMRSLAATTPAVNATAAITSASAPATVAYTFSATDTANPGNFMGSWFVTFADGSTMYFPTVGYLDITIEASLSAPIQQLVTTADVKDALNMVDANRVHDAKILRWINAVRPVIERMVGPVIPQEFEEWHDGGNSFIVLRRRPSTALGTSPLLLVNAVSEYNGPIEWPLAIIASPDQGQLYSCMVETALGRITRRTSGGGIQAFPDMAQSVHVWYQAGQQSVPDNVYEATLELIRVNYQQTAQSARPGLGRGNLDDTVIGPPRGFYVPNRVREMLAPNRRAPSLA